MQIDIEAIAEDVINEMTRKGKAPAQCDLHDILRRIAPEITNEMRQLIKSGKYTGSMTINKIPVLRRKRQ